MMKRVPFLPLMVALWLGFPGMAYAQPTVPVDQPPPGEAVGGPPNGVVVSPPMARAPSPPRKCRIKDIARVSGLNTHSLTGYGLVGGLPGSGDSQGALTSPLILNLLGHYGMDLSPIIVNGFNRNVALCIVTAELPPVCRSGDRIDVRVASLGDAKALEGGTLISSILYGPDGKVYASAQGSVTSVIPTVVKTGGPKPGVVGYVEGGATVSQNLENPAMKRNTWVWTLLEPDFSTAQRVAQVIVARGDGLSARATGPQTVEVQMLWAPGAWGARDAVDVLAQVGELEVRVDAPARVVCDQRTGTVVAGGEVSLRPATVSHRGMTVEISPQGATLKGLVDSLNKAGATPQDIVGIIKALHTSGSLVGEVILRE